MSGPGKITIYLYTEFALQALLYNFDVNSSELKWEHLNWINMNLTPHAPKIKGLILAPQRTPNMIALICGLASRTGSDELNWRLAKRRADEVSRRIRLTGEATLSSMEIKFGVGEEAARLAGFKDGVEDERWRAVFINLYDPSKVRDYTPHSRPPRLVDRRTYAKFTIGDGPTNQIPQDPEGKRAERIMKTGRKLLQAGVDIEPDEERWESMYDNLTVTRVEFQTTDTKNLWEINRLEVFYTWGELGASGRTLAKREGSHLRGEWVLSLDAMNEWVNHPTIVYRRSHLFAP
jgi:hypothetical protein